MPSKADQRTTPFSKAVRWLLIGFLAAFGLIVLTTTILIIKFWPLIIVDEKNEHIALFNNRVQINNMEDVVHIAAAFLKDDADDETNLDQTIGEEKPISEKHDHILKLKFASGKVDVKFGQRHKLTWECLHHTFETTPLPKITEDSGVFTLNLEPLKKINCTLDVPAKLKAEISGANGKITISHPQTALTVHLLNGKIQFQPDHSVHYRYRIEIKSGAADEFESSLEKDLVPISLSVKNGKIEKVD